MIGRLGVEDIIVGIFYSCYDNGVNEITLDREKLHKAFYKLKERYPEEMKKFNFRQREVFPESTELDLALSNVNGVCLSMKLGINSRYILEGDKLTHTYKTHSGPLLEDRGIARCKIEEMAKTIVKDISYKN